MPIGTYIYQVVDRVIDKIKINKKKFSHEFKNI